MKKSQNLTSLLGQYPLWVLLAAPLAFGVVLALGKWLGTSRDILGLAAPDPSSLPTEWVLASEVLVLSVMLAAAARLGRLGSLLRSFGALVWFGGVLLLTAGFFSSAYGPWGVGFSQYGAITRSLSASRLPGLLFAWPMVYGAVVVATAYHTAMSERPSAYRWRWAVAGLFLTVIAIMRLVLTLQAGARLDWTTRTVSLGSTGLVLAAIALVLIFARGERRRAHMIDLASGLWLLLALDPRGSVNGQATPLADALRGAGPGYWLQAVGTLSILMGTIGHLLTSPGSGVERPPGATDSASTRAG